MWSGSPKINHPSPLMKMKDSVYKEHSYTGKGTQMDVEISVLLLLSLFLVHLVGWWVGLGD